jgi:hypothetical protein
MAVRLDDASQDFSPVLEIHVAEIMPVEVQKVEGDKIQVLLSAGDRLSQCPKIGQTGLVEHHNFTVDDRILNAEAFRSTD